MTTEVWIRNPKLCIKECLEVGVENIAWDRGFLRKWRIDPVRFLNLHYGQSLGWRSMSIGDQGTTEYDSQNNGPVACYPTWEYGQDMELLEKIIANPAGQNPDLYWSDDEDKSLRPVEGQEHRIVISNTPPASTGLGQRFYQQLSEIQEEHPEVIIHLHGLYSFRVMFGMKFRSTDYEPRDLAAHKKVIMPVGKEMKLEDAISYPKWIKMLGFRPVELDIPRNRCMFNIVSAGWAGKHFNDEIRWSLGTRTPIDPDAPIAEGATDTRIMLRNIKAQPTDKWLCDTCSLQLDCKFFREGAVCAVPDTEPVELAHFFKTRDSNTIIDGLSTLLAAQTHRINRAMQQEEHNYEPDEDGKVKGQLDPELTKLINGLFDRGVKLAKLVDPSLRAGPKVAINSNSNNNIISAASPAGLMAAVVDELTKRGIAREDITPEMVMNIVAEPDATRGRAIEAAIVETADDGDDVWTMDEDD